MFFNCYTNLALERLAYFQLVIGPIESCMDLQVCLENCCYVSHDHICITLMLQNDAPAYLQKIQVSVLREINENLCSMCGLVDSNIRDGLANCHQTESGELSVVYRARIVGIDNYSASDLVQLLAGWAVEGQASVLVDSVRLHINSQCETSIDRLTAPDCVIQEVPTTISPILITALHRNDSLSGGEIGGLVIGVIIAVLLLLLIILLVIVLIRNSRHYFK